MLTGENGILNRAQEAKVKTEEAGINERRQIAKLEAITNLENKPYTDKNGDTAIIPAGFAVTGIEGEDVIKDGLVITDSKGNEFVWIPVTDSDSYKANTTYVHTDISANRKNDTGYLPDGVEIGEVPEGKTLEDVTFEKEKELVTKEGIEGFYISRYEAGKEDTDTLVSKKGANVWVSIAQNKEKASGQPNCKDVSKAFINDANVKSGLCTGIQWDMVMEFVNGKKDGMGQDYIVTEASSNRHHSSGVEQAGQNEYDRVCNIYDLEGNCYEYVAEKNTYHTSNHYINRGGYCDNSYSASDRHSNVGDANSFLSFRFVLYVM